MMHQLEMPLSLPGPQIDADDAFREQMVSGTMTAVVIRRRRFNGQVDEAELFIDGDLRPHTGIAVHRPRIVLPRFVAKFAGTGDRVERPQQFAGAYVERAHDAFGVVVRADGRPFTERRSDDRHVIPNRRRGMPPNLSFLEIDRLAVAVHSANFQINDAVVTKRADRRAVFRIQLDQAVTRGHVQNAFIAAAVSPIRESTAGQLTWREPRAKTFAQTVLPDLLASLA